MPADNLSPPAPLPLGVMADSGERLARIDAGARDFFAEQSVETAVSEDAIGAKQQSTKDHLGPDDDVRDPNALEQTGWAIMYGASATEGVRKRLAPLIEHRRRQVGNDKLFQIFDGQEAYEKDESASDWLIKNGKNIPNQDVDPKRGVPYYVMIVAPPDEIPFEFQFGLDLNWAVGRLWFDNEAEFGRYAESVVAYETGKSISSSRQMAVFSPRNGKDEAMNLLCDELANPMLAPTATKPAFGADQGFRLQPFIGDSATRETLEEIWRGKTAGGAPAVLFTGSHGMCFFSGDDRQDKEQGAIVCGDWPGVDPPKRSQYCAGKDLPADADFHGMIHVMFNCYGAGWPRHDTYTRLLQRHHLVGPEPRMARLPQAMLAHPNGGALAVLGHVDRAWSSSYCSKKAGSQIEGFRTVMNRIMSGQRIGYATDRWNQRWAMLSTELAEELNRNAEGLGDSDQLQNLWIARDDARNYIVFGDPAVRLRAGDLR
jgi:hypothetical protein